MAVETDVGRAPAKPPFWNDPKYRALLFQALVLGGVVSFGVFITNNTMHNLEKQGIASGFDFLNHTAGFDIAMHLIPWREDMTYGRAFVVSLLNTLLVSFLGIIFATIIGFIVGIARLAPNWLIAKLAAAYIEIFRNIPLLLQLFFWYFAVLRAVPIPRNSLKLFDMFFLNNRGLYMPSPVFLPGFSIPLSAFVLGIIGAVAIRIWARRRQERTGEPFPVLWTSLGLIVVLTAGGSAAAGFPLAWSYPKLQGFNFVGGVSLIPEFVSLLLALSIYTAAYIAEIVRAGIMSVSHGQTEAALSLGLRPGQNLRLVVIPQALRVIIPPLTSEYLNLTKNSSLAAAIAYPDLILVFAGTVLMQTGQAVEVIAMAMAVYLSISLAISFLMNLYNRHIALVER